MTELFFFFLVGAVAVIAAILMLMSDNAVHSALFLIVTMVCIAFLFLLLNASFLAMIQITVYTGAIMVLFLFVIMLLGAERLHIAEASPQPATFRGYTILAAALVGVLLLIVGIALNQVNLGLQTDVGPLPLVRVVNAAPDAGTVDVYANDQLIASGLAFRESSTYASLTPGDYELRVQPVNGTPVTTTVSLQRGTQQTLVDYGTDAVTLSVVSDDNSTISEHNSGRLRFFNATSAPVQVVDPGSDLDPNDSRVVVDSIGAGQTSDVVVEPENTVNLNFVDPANTQTMLTRLEDFAVNRDTSGLVVVTEQRTFEGSTEGVLQPVAVPVVVESAPAFGGPRAIGLELFTNYMLVFQLLAVLLLAAMVGAIVLTHRELKSVTRKSGERRRVSRPLVNVIAAQVGHDVTSSGEGVPELQEPANSAPAGD